MLRLPGKTPLPAAAAGRLEKADCCRLLQVPGASAGERHAFLCPSLTSLNGVTLALSLPQERTELGRGLVRGLWFDQPLTLWLCGAGTTQEKITVKPPAQVKKYGTNHRRQTFAALLRLSILAVLYTNRPRK